MLLKQASKNKVLRTELDMLRKQLEDKKIRIRKSGTLAEAVDWAAPPPPDETTASHA